MGEDDRSYVSLFYLELCMRIYIINTNARFTFPEFWCVLNSFFLRCVSFEGKHYQ